MQGNDSRDTAAASTTAGVPTFPGESTGTRGRPADEEPGGAGSGEATSPEATTPEATTPEATSPGDTSPEADAEAEVPRLLAPEDEATFRARWQEVQNAFVDDPRDAVHTADALVADVMQELAATFAEHKQELEGQWNRGEEADTEELRQALRHYRAFFNRLLVT